MYRSLIILEVEHGEDTDNLEELINKILIAAPKIGAPVQDYTIKAAPPAALYWMRRTNVLSF